MSDYSRQSRRRGGHRQDAAETCGVKENSGRA